MGRSATAFAVAAAVVWLSWANGGYFPSEWGIGIVACALVCLGAVVLRDRIQLSRRDLLLVGALGALLLWTVLSVLWTTSDGQVVHEAERVGFYTLAAAALLLAIDGTRVASVLAGVVGGAAAVAVYGLATRLAPGHVGGAYDPSSGYQLAEPIGYWNALGALMAMALLLALAAARSESVVARAAGGAVLVPLAATLYFTYSRGSLVALAAGLVVLVAVERARLRSAVECSLLGALCLVVAQVCSAKPALTAAGATLQTAQAQGRHLAWQLAFLTVVAAVGAVVLPRATGRLAAARLPRRASVIGATVAVAAIVAVALAAVGGPSSGYDRFRASFSAEPEPTGTDLDSRLLSVSGHGRSAYWRVAFEMAADRPVTGTGAGTFERYWLEQRPVAHHARDAHNLYLETLGELGVIGLVLLVAALAVPFTALPLARAHPFGAAAAAAFASFLVHAGVEWDWEVAAVTLPALAAGATLVVLGRGERSIEIGRRLRVIVGAAAVLAVAVGGIVHAGNRAAAASSDALARGDTVAAGEVALRARRYQPWSAEPWILLGDAHLAGGRDAQARSAYREAVARDPSSWVGWLGLAVSDPPNGAAHLERARAGNPLSRDLDELEAELRTDS